MVLAALCFCLEDIEDSLDSCAELEQAVHFLVEVDLSGVVAAAGVDGVDIGNLQPDSKV